VALLLASIRISNGSLLVYYDHYTKLHIVATLLQVAWRFIKFSVGIVFVLNRSGTIQNIIMYNCTVGDWPLSVVHFTVDKVV